MTHTAARHDDRTLAAIGHAWQAENSATAAAQAAAEAEQAQLRAAAARLAGQIANCDEARTTAHLWADAARAAADTAAARARLARAAVVSDPGGVGDPMTNLAAHQTDRAATRAELAHGDAVRMADRALSAAQTADEDADAESDLGEV